MGVIRLVKKLVKPLMGAIDPSTLYFVKNINEYKSDLYFSSQIGDKLVDISTERLRSDTVKKYAPIFNPLVLALAYKDTLTLIAPGVDVAYIRAPRRFVLRHIRMSVFAPSTAGVVEVNVKLNGVSIVIGQNVTIDVDESSSLTSTIDYNLGLPGDGIIVNNDDIISFDVIEAGTGATGLVVQFHEGQDSAFNYNE